MGTVAVEGETLIVAAVPGVSVTCTEADLASAVAVTAAEYVPGVQPAVNRPLELTEPAAPDAVQVMTTDGSGLFSMSYAMALNCCVPSTDMVWGEGVTMTYAAGSG